MECSLLRIPKWPFADRMFRLLRNFDVLMSVVADKPSFLSDLKRSLEIWLEVTLGIIHSLKAI